MFSKLKSSKKKARSSQTESSHASSSQMESSHASSSTERPSTVTTQVEQQTYDPIEYDSDDDDHGVPDENLEIAAYIMAGLLGKNQVQHAAVGGFSLKMRGSTRKTNDVDFGVNITPRSLWDFITQVPQRYSVSTCTSQ